MRLEKSYLKSEFNDRECHYQSLLEEKSVQKFVVSSLISTIFKDDTKALLTHFVREGGINSNEIKNPQKWQGVP
jgi:predicted transcriptional regulator